MPNTLATVGPWGAVSLGVLLSLSAGCGLLDTQTPDIILPNDLNSKEGAQARRIGAIADFTLARDGDGNQTIDGQILLNGLMTDEFVLSTTPPSEQDFDQRNVTESNEGITSSFLDMQRARVAAENAALALEQYDPTAESEISEMFGLAGYMYIQLGEDFCSGVPYSHVAGDSLIYGGPTTTDSTFQIAITRFDSALGRSGATATVKNLARVGKGRALLNLGQYSAAAQAVQSVPSGFRAVTEHETTPTGLQNPIWSYTNGGLWSMMNQEGVNGLPFLSANDPRVPYFDTGTEGLDGSTPQINLLKYPAPDSPIVVADGTEARLIEAEAQYQAGQYSAMFTTLNNLRAGVPGLPPLTDPGNNTARVDTLFSERAFWMFATGHRLGDLRRMVRQYGRAANTVFPIGPYLKGGLYGSDVNMIMPIQEKNNPLSQGCLNRDA